MDLDLERFWKMVRPKRHKPIQAKEPISFHLYVEAVDLAHRGRCTNPVRVGFSKRVINEVSGYYSDIQFGVVERSATVVGFRLSLTPNEVATLIECDPYHLNPGDSLSLGLHIQETNSIMQQLRLKGLVV